MREKMIQPCLNCKRTPVECGKLFDGINMCLICGKTICRTNCPEGVEKNIDPIFEHSIKSHMGQGVCLNLRDAKVYVIFEENFRDKGVIYYDSFG